MIGSLRAGGAGKTSVASALARELARRGLRPALLAYRIGPGVPRAPGGNDLMEVAPDSDWRASSEEAVLLRRETGMRVFATRDRARAWRRLAGAVAGEMARAEESFDVLIADDGFQDPRLFGAFRILLARPGEGPRRRDSLPAGPFREDASAIARADLVLTGPWAAGPDGVSGAARVTGMLPGDPDADPAGSRFRRRTILPGGWDRSRPCLVHCSLGDPRPFLADLERAGIRPAGIILGRNHGEPPLGRLRAAVALFPGAPILCTRKDAVKLEGAGLPLATVDQEIELDSGVADRIAGLVRANPYLVDYPRC